MKLNTRKVALSGMFIAIGILLPFLTGQIPQIGTMLAPMHIPVFICGYVCGWPYGLAVGAITPVLRSAIFTMPPMMPAAVAMMFELAVYGLLTGILSRALPNKKGFTYLSLVISMLIGRLVWGLVSIPIYGAMGNAFTAQLFLAGGFINAWPGMILHLVIIPPIVFLLRKADVAPYADQRA
jgi:hypothetical protein